MTYEAEILPGLKPFVQSELRRRFRKQIRLFPGDDAANIGFEFLGHPHELLVLRTAVAVYRVITYDIPRPRALLGHQHLTRLIKAIDKIRGLHPAGSFRSFRLSAAGQDSAVFARLKDELSTQAGLVHEPDDADLFLRVRPVRGRQGWEVLIRLSPRPLSARPWRVCDMPGALNATVASAMIELTHPQGKDHFLNLMCGSGTLLIERALHRSVGRLVGCDIDPLALTCAGKNIAAAGLEDLIEVVPMDATRLDFPDGAFDALCADFPWGQLVGSQEELTALYPAALAEVARVAAPGARFALVTHAVRLFDGLLEDIAHQWTVEDVVRIYQGGLHPRIYVLRRR